MSAVATIEGALDKIAADNDLTSVTVGRMVVGDRIIRTATVHYTGHSKCQLGSSDNSCREALYDAIQKAAADRATAVMPCELPVSDLAAA